MIKLKPSSVVWAVVDILSALMFTWYWLFFFWALITPPDALKDMFGTERNQTIYVLVSTLLCGFSLFWLIFRIAYRHADRLSKYANPKSMAKGRLVITAVIAIAFLIIRFIRSLRGM